MPKVKTITPGRLSGLSTLTSELASDISQQKEREYLKAVSDWKEEKEKLDAIKEDQLNYIDQKMQLIAGMDQLASENFDDTFKENLMNDVKNYASIVSDIKLGNIDAAEGYMKLAKYDKKLTDLQTAIPNINTLASKVNDAINKEDGEIGAMIHDGTGDTYNIAKILHDLYHPSRNRNVSYQTIDGQDFIVHKDGQKISIPGLNAIMSGNNPDYPISFAESPDEALGQLYDAMWKRNGNGATYLVDVKEESYNKKGGITTTTRKKYNIADDSQFSKDLKETVAPMIDDQEKMRVIWNNIGGDGKWENDEDQRSQAVDLLYKRAKDLYAPKSNVTNVDIKLPRPSKDKDKDKDKDKNTKVKLIDYSPLYNANQKFKKGSNLYVGGNKGQGVMDMEEAKIEVEDFFNTIQGRRRFNISGNPIVSKIEVSYVDPKVPAKGLQFMPFRSYRGEDIELVDRPFNIDNVKDLEFFEKLLKPLGSDVITVDDNTVNVDNTVNIDNTTTSTNNTTIDDSLPNLTRDQASKLKDGDKFILVGSGTKFDGKKFVMRMGQDGKLEE